MVPNFLSEVEKCRREHPQAWAHAHTGDAHTEDFIRLLAARLHKIDPRFGLNGKRGDPRTISQDALNFKGEGPGHDPTNDNMPVTVIDVIGAAGSSGAYPTWQVFDALPGPGAWVSPVAPPPVETKKSVLPVYPGDEIFDRVGHLLFQDYAEARQQPNAGMARWIGRVVFDYLTGMSMEDAIIKHRDAWKHALHGR